MQRFVCTKTRYITVYFESWLFKSSTVEIAQNVAEEGINQNNYKTHFYYNTIYHASQIRQDIIVANPGDYFHKQCRLDYVQRPVFIGDDNSSSKSLRSSLTLEHMVITLITYYTLW